MILVFGQFFSKGVRNLCKKVENFPMKENFNDEKDLF
jgi:hypothetical protein